MKIENLSNNEASFSGSATINIIDQSEEALLVQIQGIQEMNLPFWIPKEEAETEAELNPQKIIRWVFRQINKYFNGQEDD